MSETRGFWREVFEACQWRSYIYGLVTGFFLGQAFIMGLLIWDRISKGSIWMW